MIEDISERLLREFAARLQESLARDPGLGETGDGAGAADEETADEDTAEEDRWQTVNVAALKRDAAPAGDEPPAASEGSATVAEAPATEQADGATAGDKRGAGG